MRTAAIAFTKVAQSASSNVKIQVCGEARLRVVLSGKPSPCVVMTRGYACENVPLHLSDRL